jgi:hypothetical protein
MLDYHPIINMPEAYSWSANFCSQHEEQETTMRSALDAVAPPTRQESPGLMAESMVRNKHRTIKSSPVQYGLQFGAGAAGTFSVWTEFTAPTGKRVFTREECHWTVTHMQELQAEQRRETQWHPRV